MSCQNLANRNEGLTKRETTSQTLKFIISLRETTVSVQKCEKNTKVRFEDCSIQDILVLHQEPGTAEKLPSIYRKLAVNQIVNSLIVNSLITAELSE